MPKHMSKIIKAQ
jgi:hypothetical protein